MTQLLSRITLRLTRHWMCLHQQTIYAHRCRWTALKPEFEKVLSYIDEKAEYIRESNEINLKMWPVEQNVNEDIDLSYDDAVNRLKEAYQERITELDKVISNY